MARNGSEMTMTEVLVRAEGLDVNEVPDGYVIYQTAADRVHYLNKTAAIVFELCDGARGADDIVARVSQMFEVEGTARRRNRGLHSISAQGGAGPIAFEVIARTWSRRVTLCTSDAAVFQAIRYLECDPEIAGEPVRGSHHLGRTLPFLLSDRAGRRGHARADHRRKA